MSYRKILKTLAIIILSAMGLILVSSIVLSQIYEKAVVKYLKSYLDEHLLTQLSMDGIHFTLLKGFPKATIEITNPVLLSGRNFSKGDFGGAYSDTLLQAKSVLLQFNLIKLYRKEYELKKIEVTQGHVNILIDSHKRHNLDIWKSSVGSGANYSVDLRSIVITSTRIRIISLPQKFTLYAYSSRTNFHGSFSENILSGDTRGTFNLESLIVKKSRLMTNSSVDLAIKMVYSGNRFRISHGTIKLNKAIAEISGEYTGGKRSSIDLTLNMPKFGLDELMSLIPGNNSFTQGNFTFNGNGKMNLTLRGSFSDPDHIFVTSGFELENCTARNNDTRTAFKQINLHGTVSGTNRNNFNLRLDRASASLGAGTVNGSFTLNNLNKLLFTSEVHAMVDLEALNDFAAIDTIEKLNGSLRSDFTVSGSLRKLSRDSALTALSFLQNGIFRFENAGIKLKNFPVTLDHVTGTAVWDNDVRFDSLSMRINETDLMISGSIQHLTDYLLYHGFLKSSLEISTDNLDISKYLNQPTGTKTGSGYKSLSLFPSRIYMKAHLKAGNFTAGKFKASSMSVNLSALKDSMYLENFSLRFSDGSISGYAFITVDSNHMFSITCNAQPNKIDIQQLFYAFNNFTQHFIMDKNMKGQLGGTVSFFAQWDSTLKIIPASMKAKADIEITNGELVHFEPMLKLSKYINVDELKDIHFSTLKNTIYIDNRMVSIPEMDINSSAFNISASGQHSFENKFDYRLNVLLSQVLFNRARKKKKEMNEFLVEETREDQTTIPLIIAGTPDNFDVRFDRKKAFSLTRRNMNNSIPPENKPDPGNFKIQWEEPQDKGSAAKQDDSKSNPSDFKIEWNE